MLASEPASSSALLRLPYSPLELPVLLLLSVLMLVLPVSIFLPLYVLLDPNSGALLCLGAWPPLLLCFPVFHETCRRLVLRRIRTYRARPASSDLLKRDAHLVMLVPLANRWIWRPTLYWGVLSVPLLVVPLAVLLPLGLASGLDLSYQSSPEAAAWFFSLAVPVGYLGWDVVWRRRRVVAGSDGSSSDTPSAGSAAAAATARNDGLLEIQLGCLYPLYGFARRRPGLVLRLFAGWAFVYVPLACGLSKCIYDQVLGRWPPVSTVPTADVQWQLCFFAIVLPAVFFLALGIVYMLPLRSPVYGEVEARGDREALVEARELARRMNLGEECVLEYPHWSMGEHLVTTGIKSRSNAGRALNVTRAAVVVFGMGVCPVVVLAPTYQRLKHASPGFEASPWAAVVLFLLIGWPVAVVACVVGRLLTDALPNAAKNALGLAGVWALVAVVLPCCGAIPALVYAPGWSAGAQSLLYGLLVLGPLGFSAVAAHALLAHRRPVREWAARLTVEPRALRKVLSVSFRLCAPLVCACPLTSLGLVLAGLARLDAQLDADEGLPVAVAVCELVGAVALAVGCDAGVNLGWLRPTMQPRGVLPFLYIAAGLFAAAQMTVQNTRPQQDLLQMQQVLGQVTAWICVQLAALLALALQVRAARSEHERFGYFAEPWELLEPASRFIVKEAARVAHMSDEELSRELERRHLPHQRGDRRGMEGALERDIAAVKAKEEQAAAREREERAARHKRFEKGRLAQTLMKEVLIKAMARQDGGGGGDGLVSFEVSKLSMRLSRAAAKRLPTQPRPTHVAELTSSELRLCNMAFGAFRAFALPAVASFAWITSEAAATQDLPWSALRLVEVCMVGRAPRVLAFASVPARDAFVAALVDVATRTGLFEYMGRGRLERVREASPDAASAPSADI